MKPLPPRKLTRAERDAARGKLARMRKENVARRLAQLTRAAMAEGRAASPFAYEALFVAGLRAFFCLQGWRWQHAHEAAGDVVRISLEILQAKRPSWGEGQPDWTIQGGALVKRERCANCGNRIDDDHYKFCGALCAGAYHSRLTYRRKLDESRTLDLAVQSDRDY